jgi:hypothetical protein
MVSAPFFKHHFHFSNTFIQKLGVSPQSSKVFSNLSSLSSLMKIMLLNPMEEIFLSGKYPIP